MGTANKGNITKRIEKGSALTHVELDQNFVEIENVIDDIATVDIEVNNRVDAFSQEYDENIDSKLQPYVDSASQEVTKAGNEADRAETARDAAQLSAGVYADTASGLGATAQGDYFSVPSDESDEHLILYRHDAGPTAAEVKRYPSASLIGDADGFGALVPRVQALEENRDGGDDLELASDRSGALYRRVDSEGHEYLPHLAESVQHEVNARRGEVGAAHGIGGGSGSASDLLQIHDDNGNVVAAIDARGGTYHPGEGASVQHLTRQRLHRDVGRFTGVAKTSRDQYPASVTAKVQDLQLQQLPFIEPPPLLVPNGYDVPNSILNNIVLSDDNPVAQLEFPHIIGGSVHPYLLPVRRPMYGYNILLLDSNHKNGTSAEETAVMFGTNDMQHFDLIPDVPQPLSHSAPGKDGNTYSSYNSDPFFAYDPSDGALVWGNRESFVVDPGNTDYLMSKTYDGVNWTPITRILSPSEGKLSPSILYDFVTEEWHLWAGSEGSLHHYTGPSFAGPWTLQTSTNFNTTHNIDIWHFEVKYLGIRFALCCCSRDSGTDTEAQVYLGLSSDGDTWTMSPGLVQPQSADIYKPTFYPEFDGENLLRLTFAWAHWDWVNHTAANDMQLYVQRSAWIDLTTL